MLKATKRPVRNTKLRRAAFGAERVSVDGDKAQLEALVEAQHLPSSDQSRHYLMKNRYDVELVREGDAWVIQRMAIDNVWRSSDPTVLAVI